MATSEGDITLTAANIVAEQDVGIHAAGDLSIRSGQDTLGNARENSIQRTLLRADVLQQYVSQT